MESEATGQRGTEPEERIPEEKHADANFLTAKIHLEGSKLCGRAPTLHIGGGVSGLILDISSKRIWGGGAGLRKDDSSPLDSSG